MGWLGRAQRPAAFAACRLSTVDRCQPSRQKPRGPSRTSVDGDSPPARLSLGSLGGAVLPGLVWSGLHMIVLCCVQMYTCTYVHTPTQDVRRIGTRSIRLLRLPLQAPSDVVQQHTQKERPKQPAGLQRQVRLLLAFAASFRLDLPHPLTSRCRNGH